jgi:Uma2 family endonuclease
MTMISNRPLVSSIYDRLLVQDDTEESVSGSDYHLMAILALYEVLLRFARQLGRRWYVTAEVLLLVDVPERDRNPWRPMPDVYVVLDTDQVERQSYDTRTGLAFPQFVCEVVSESTWGEDISGKQRLYADLGTQEYIVFDPTQQLLGASIRAWHRRDDGAWGRWQPDDEGFLISRVLEGLRFRAEGTLLRVYHAELGLLPTGDELAQLAREQEEQAREQARRLEASERAVREQASELERERALRRQLEERLARVQGQEGGAP